MEVPYPDEEEPPIQPEEDFQPLISKERMERTIRRNTKRNNWYKEQQAKIADLTDKEKEDENNSQAEGGKYFALGTIYRFRFLFNNFFTFQPGIFEILVKSN